MYSPNPFFYIGLVSILWQFEALGVAILALIGATLLAVGARCVFLRLFLLTQARFAMKYVRVSVPKDGAVIITGTSTGFGKATVQDLAQTGIHVLASIRKVEDGQRLLESIPEEHRKNVTPFLLGMTLATTRPRSPA